MLISNAEKDLIMTIREVEYGELYDILIVKQKPQNEVGMRRGNVKLIKCIRENPEVEKIVIHEGEAKQVEVLGKSNDFRYRRKIRL
mgnify:CR=1 FL=1